MLTASELIKILEGVPPDMPVLLRGYEGGFYSPQAVSPPTTYAKDYYEEWYYGPHERVDYLTNVNSWEGDHETFQAVSLY